MNTKKPNSIQLAEDLEAQVQLGGGDLQTLNLAASELRMLHAEQHNLISAVKDFLHADNEWNTQPDTWSFSTEKAFRRLVDLRNRLQATVDQIEGNT